MLGTNSELTIGVPSREPTNAKGEVSVLVFKRVVVLVGEGREKESFVLYHVL